MVKQKTENEAHIGFKHDDDSTSPALSGDLSNALLPPTRETLADQIIDQLREAIVKGQIAAGEPLRVAQLARSLGVSQGPIREALARLEREGLVIMRPNRTALVAQLTWKDFEQVYSLRLALETLAVQCVVRNITSAEIDELQAIVDHMVQRVSGEIAEKEAADLDLQFHDALYRMSQHKRLQSFWEDLRPQIYIFLLSRNVANADFRQQMVGHQEIVDLIREGDAEQVVACIEEHIGFAYQRISHRYKKESGDALSS